MVKHKNHEHVPQSLPQWALVLLSPEDLKIINQTVQAAESTTSGEIVPILVHSSCGKTTIRPLFSLVLVFLGLAGAPMVTEYFTPSIFLYFGEAIAIFSLFLLGQIIPLPLFVQRLVIPLSEQILRVEQRAELEFYRAKIQGTAGRTGILLFVSLMEHRAVVLADKAISDKLPQETWDEVLQLLLKGFKSKQVQQGYCAAISRCGDILSSHFPRSSDDVDELVNELLISE
jgi:putative membrane protein